MDQISKEQKLFSGIVNTYETAFRAGAFGVNDAKAIVDNINLLDECLSELVDLKAIQPEGSGQEETESEEIAIPGTKDKVLKRK